MCSSLREMRREKKGTGFCRRKSSHRRLNWGMNTNFIIRITKMKNKIQNRQKILTKQKRLSWYQINDPIISLC